jgi:hypothetical protein
MSGSMVEVSRMSPALEPDRRSSAEDAGELDGTPSRPGESNQGDSCHFHRAEIIYLFIYPLRSLAIVRGYGEQQSHGGVRRKGPETGIFE